MLLLVTQFLQLSHRICLFYRVGVHCVCILCMWRVVQRKEGCVCLPPCFNHLARQETP